MQALTSAEQRLHAAPAANCPLCEEGYGGSRHDGEAVHRAAHCCLWHEFDYATRARIANRVEAGASWLEAIKEARK